MRFLCTLVIGLCAAVPASAQVSLPAGSTVTVDFAGYTGAGLAPFPSSGQLDSDAWSVQGLSEGDTGWGLTHASGDFARGPSAGGVSTGGVYAFYAAGAGDPALGLQPTESDLTPGSITLRVRNDTGATLARVSVSFDGWFYNDEDRATLFVFEHSEDDVTYTATSLSAETVDVAAASPIWFSLPFTTTIDGLSVAAGDYFYLRWTITDAGGAGSRDEVALDDVRISALGGCASHADCDDEDACNGDELCTSGTCTSGTPLDCDDLDPCTADACDAVTGCSHEPIAGCVGADAGPPAGDAGAEVDAGPGSDASGPAPDDGGASGTDGGGPAPSTRGRRRSGGCSVAPGGAAPIDLLGLALAGMLALARRRR